jgi:hypothetical protein
MEGALFQLLLHKELHSETDRQMAVDFTSTYMLIMVVLPTALFQVQF